MKILAFAGSNSSTSINKELVKCATSYFVKDEVNLIDLNDFEMPIFSIDREKIGFPEKVHEFIKLIEESDCIICSVAEHNSNLTAALKNILDWTSRAKRDFFAQKPMLLLSTSPGGYGGGNAMEIALKMFPKFDGNIIAHFSLPKFNDNFDLASSKILNVDLANQFNLILEDFKVKISK